MNKFILSAVLIPYLSLCVTSVAHAEAPKAARKSRVEVAADLIGGLAESYQMIQLTPGDAKAMMQNMATKDSGMSVEEFEENWLGKDSDAWGADNGAWGYDDANGARDYVESVLQQTLEEGERNDADKVKYADAMLTVERAFSLIRGDQSIQYGVAPRGAVQCGVTFAELVILDTKTGTAYEIAMEGSGC